MHVLAKVPEQVVVHPQPRARIAAVIPAFNESRFIASVVLEALDYVDLVIVIDDGSTDHTAILAERAGACVVRLDGNTGKAHALNAGFARALQEEVTVVVCLDADAQHDPADIPAVVGPVLSGDADVVIGTRFHATSSRIPPWRQVGQHTLTLVTNTLSGTRVSDSQSGFRAFSIPAARALRFKSGGLSVESEMQFLFAPAGLRVSEVDISVSYRDGNKRNPVVHGMQVLDTMLTLVARRRPLLFFSMPGTMMAMGGLAVVALATHRAQQITDVNFGLALFAVALVICGLLLGLSGILLHSVGHLAGRIRDEVETLIYEPRTTEKR